MAFLSSFYPQPVVAGTTEGTFAEGDDSRIVGAAQKAANLSDLASASSARANLDLEVGVDVAAANHNHAASAINSGTLDIARIPTGTTSTTVAIGNDSRITGAATKAWVAGVTKTIYVAVRTDGVAGSGTMVDPYDASTAEKLDNIIKNVIPVNGTLHFLEGNYETFVDGGWFGDSRWKDGISVIGAGIDKTIIKCIGRSNNNGVFVLRGNNIVVRDLTVDCNYQNVRVAGGKSEAVNIEGDNCKIINVKAINYGGDPDTLTECFVMYIAGDNGLIDGCQCSNPQKSVNNKYYISGGYIFNDLNYYPSGTQDRASNCCIRNCSFYGSSDLSDLWILQGFAIQTDGVLENCYFERASAGVYYDTGIFESAWIKNCIFENCGVSLMYQMGLLQEANDVSKQIYFQHNKMYVGNLSSGWNCYFAHSQSLYLDGNFFRKSIKYPPSNEFAPSFLIWIRNAGSTPDYLNGGNGFLYAKNNVFSVDDFPTVDTHNFIVTGSPLSTHLQNWDVENNTDTKGLELFILCRYKPYFTVSGNNSRTPEDNGIILNRAFLAQQNAIPYGNPRSATNIATLFIEPAYYKIPTFLPFTSPTIGFKTWIGTGRSEETIIESLVGGNAEGRLIQLDNGDYYNFENITFVSGSLCVMAPPYVTGGPNSGFKNCIFKDNSASNGSVAAAINVNMTWENCKFQIKIHDNNASKTTNGKWINCSFVNNGIPQTFGSDSQIINCTVPITQFQTVINGIVKNSLFNGNESYGISVGTTALIENCRFKNTWLLGSGGKVYSSLISTPSAQTYSIAGSGSWEIFSIGANKPIDPSTTITNLNSANTITSTIAPSSAPDFVGQQYINTASGIAYIATGTSSSSDWKALATWNP